MYDYTSRGEGNGTQVCINVHVLSQMHSNKTTKFNPIANYVGAMTVNVKAPHGDPTWGINFICTIFIPLYFKRLKQ